MAKHNQLNMWWFPFYTVQLFVEGSNDVISIIWTLQILMLALKCSNSNRPLHFIEFFTWWKEMKYANLLILYLFSGKNSNGNYHWTWSNPFPLWWDMHVMWSLVILWWHISSYWQGIYCHPVWMNRMPKLMWQEIIFLIGIMVIKIYNKLIPYKLSSSFMFLFSFFYAFNVNSSLLDKIMSWTWIGYNLNGATCGAKHNMIVPRTY